eukprot:GFUD01037245.1.p1 GENE.GFUD01037245.1~~GFUD01037245.1.p1  ORF type:complete len:265 (-),score=79.60 GFUD01037245.1:63-749(-)
MNSLPTEILERILHLLPPSDLRMVVLVCRRWREIGEDPSLWTWGMVRVASRGDLDMLHTRRLQHVQEIGVGGQLESLELEELVRAVVRLTRLKYLDLRGNNLSSVEPGLLSEAVMDVKTVDMNDCQLTSQQVETILTAVSGQTKLKTLYIRGNNLSTVQPAVLANINWLQDVYMYNTQLTGQQITCILTRATQGTTLEWLVLARCVTGQVDKQIVEQARQAIGILDIW